MFRKLIATVPDGAVAVLRVVLGIVMLAHGLQKTFGLFGGYGFQGTMGFFTQQMHIPAVFAFLAIAAEFAGGLGLIVGLLGRVAAFGVAVNMLVAMILVHLPVGFFMNWNGNLKGEGYEYHLLAIAMAVAIMLRGSGAASIDLALSQKR
ncbi:MAG: DoxX family protein [Acidobacteria bacterium]|nr:DoxX family protein [Acidobacteriota bacterium]MBV9478097.1 DoxX family protein [Acidobacteriota bacterium]